MEIDSTWDLDRIRAILPHRGRMLLCRSAEIGTASRQGRCQLSVPAANAAEAWPEKLTCPHLIVIEAAAQLAGLVLAAGAREEQAEPVSGYLAEVPDMRFGPAPAAGSPVSIEVTAGISFGALHRFDVRAHQGSAMVLEGTLTVAIA